jgi:hypothetical protein
VDCESAVMRQLDVAVGYRCGGPDEGCSRLGPAPHSLPVAWRRPAHGENRVIFLSHNSKDKVLVEPFALRLAQSFGQDDVFYDSWSIQPGEGIVDRMNKGLHASDLFFFFVSANSLGSKMVGLEWQNALMKATAGQMRLIPVRLDASLLPPILLQTLYLDLFTNGLENTLRQVIDIASGKSTFAPQHQGFSNVTASATQVEKKWAITIRASHFTEPRCRFFILSDDTQDTANVSVERAAMYESGFQPELKLNNGLTTNGFLIGLDSALTPNFPMRISLTGNDSRPSLHGVLHEKAENRWEAVPLSEGTF